MKKNSIFCIGSVVIVYPKVMVEKLEPYYGSRNGKAVRMGNVNREEICLFFRKKAGTILRYVPTIIHQNFNGLGISKNRQQEQLFLYLSTYVPDKYP